MKLKYFILFFLLLSFSATNFVDAKSDLGDVIRSIKNQKGTYEEGVIRFMRSDKSNSFSQNEIEKIASELDPEAIEHYPEACYLVAKFFQDKNEYKKAYFYLYKTLKTAPDLSDQSKVYLPQFHEKMGVNYFYFRRYEESMSHLKKALSFKSCSESAKININNTIGLIYRNKKDSEKSKYYFEKAYRIAKEQKEEAWIGVLSGNLGFIEYEAKNYDEARRLLHVDLDFSRKNDQGSSEFNALTALIKIKIINGGPDDLESMLNRLAELCEQDGSVKTKWAYFETIAFHLESIGDFKNALINQKIERELRDSILANRDELAILNYEFQIDFERKQAEIEVLNEKREKESLRSLGIIILLLILLLASIVIVRQILKRRKKEKELFYLKQATIEDELRNSEKELNSILTTLIDKNILIEELKTKIESGSLDKELNEQQENLIEMLQSFTLLTEEDWISFKQVFEKLHRGFFVYFRKEFPECTTSEMRLAALIRLNLTNSEMANVLGISPNSVRKTSLRLRKKLNISSVDELAKFILNLDTSL